MWACCNRTLLCFRLAPQLMASPPQLSVAPANPIAMPVFPLRPTPSPYSPYSPSRFHIDKRCQHRCSWKCCSIALILLSVALTGMLAYFGGEYTSRMCPFCWLVFRMSLHRRSVPYVGQYFLCRYTRYLYSAGNSKVVWEVLGVDESRPLLRPFGA